MINTKQQTVRAIKAIKRKTGWSTRELGAQTGVGYSMLSRIISKNDSQSRNPRLGTREKIWACYEKQVDGK